VDLSPLTPERLRGAGSLDVSRIALVSGNRTIPAGDLFEVEPGDPGDIVMRGGCARLDFIGAGMRQGSLTVEGDTGAYLGQGMRGGRLRVTGNAGPWAGAAMRGGVLEIGGDAGDFLGGALPGEMRGMSGGVVAVRGRAGERAGDRMRRGVIVVEGGVGAYAGSRMIAGTLLVLGSGVGAYPGFGMKRGTLWLRCPPSRALPTFADSGWHEFGFLRLLRGALAGAGIGSRSLQDLGLRARRFMGDAAVAGKGEILVSQS
jgi:formylmethanofuran dehydrogenase subunit C